MPERRFSNPYTQPGPFDLKAASETITQALMGYLQIVVRAPGTAPDPEQAAEVMRTIQEALSAGAHACAEVTRIRAELTALRDGHRPQPHADPAKPGALCAACSMHGSIVNWPCSTWTAAEGILTRGKA